MCPRKLVNSSKLVLRKSTKHSIMFATLLELGPRNSRIIQPESTKASEKFSIHKWKRKRPSQDQNRCWDELQLSYAVFLYLFHSPFGIETPLSKRQRNHQNFYGKPNPQYQVSKISINRGPRGKYPRSECRLGNSASDLGLWKSLTLIGLSHIFLLVIQGAAMIHTFLKEHRFILTEWDEIAPHLLDMFNHILERGTLTSSRGQAALRLIPKCQDACWISDFRPISILNCDYKITAFVLARRLRHTLPDTTGPHEKGMLFNTKMTGDVMVLPNLWFNVWAMLLSEKTLRKLTAWLTGTSSGGYWRLWVAILLSLDRTMYWIAGISIHNGTELVGDIDDIHSIRQGCPLSMHLFVLYYEPLLIRLSHDLQGIRFFNQKLVIRALIDDVTIFVSCYNDLVIAGRVLELFCQWTKARMNKQKTKIL
ncbi:Uncharacterized protein APZ42_031466 [Daphnia magna]|uniref:Reverse transcriptase domain-containing protein n=1 Tax=Daphnia magna TaxID=35525 RepID=A0A162DBG1_9CRUS|nr:Uncharacterized protein APZ42_031466 [Daphnia magna]